MKDGSIPFTFHFQWLPCIALCLLLWFTESREHNIVLMYCVFFPQRMKLVKLLGFSSVCAGKNLKLWGFKLDICRKNQCLGVSLTKEAPPLHLADQSYVCCFVVLLVIWLLSNTCMNCATVIVICFAFSDIICHHVSHPHPAAERHLWEAVDRKVSASADNYLADEAEHVEAPGAWGCERVLDQPAVHDCRAGVRPRRGAQGPELAQDQRGQIFQVPWT